MELMDEINQHVNDTARALLINMAHAIGKEMPVPERRTSGEGPYGECWTNAWELAMSDDTLRYCEGVCTYAHPLKQPRHHAHAWVVDLNGFVIDPTESYQHSYAYRGFILRKDEVERATADWDGPRSSVVECLFAAGQSVPQIIARFVEA